MSHISSHFARPHTSRSVGALPFTEDIEVRWVNRRVSNTRVAYAPPPCDNGAGAVGAAALPRCRTR